MSPRRRVLVSALGLCAAWVLAIAAPAFAQTYDDALRTLGLAPDPLARSPKLIGMGRLTLVGEDPHNRISLWDFGGNPTGIAEIDTTSSVEFRPVTASESSLHNITRGSTVLERQDLALRGSHLDYEAWHRSSERNVYGLTGSLGMLRFDQPSSDVVERRSSISQPSTMAVVGGRMPFFLGDRMTYALRFLGSYQSTENRYRSIVTNGVGEYIDLNGQIGDAPDYFVPEDQTIRTLGGGAAVSYRLGAPLTIAVGADRIGDRIVGTNEGFRHQTKLEESRPYSRAQATLVGQLGKSVHWGADLQAWRATSAPQWLFTTSAGTATQPLTGRGRLFDRKEEGSDVRARAQWMMNSFEFGVGASYYYSALKITPPNPGDPVSFNAFRNQIFYRIGADTLSLPDSVLANVTADHAWEAGGGLSWKLPERRGTIGAEYHRSLAWVRQQVSGYGPESAAWDARLGIDYVATSVLNVRSGFVHRWEDRDRLTAQNEYISNGVTFGLGLRPKGTEWSVQGGYLLEWSDANFGDPGKSRSNRQEIGVQVLLEF